MNADGIIFDKDGTLIDFDAFWVSVSVKAMEDLLKALDRTDIPLSEILEAFGIHDGVTDVDGVLCKGTYEQMGQIVCDILNGYGCGISCDEAVKRVIGAYGKNADGGDVKPTCPDLAETLKTLKTQGKKLAVVTTDNEPITRKCLRDLGIEDLFDAIYTDDGINPPKPDPYCAFDFCKVAKIAPERLVMVGDTMTDVKFARNAGISVIGVAKTEGHKAILAPHADAVIPAISDLPGLLERFL